jgi:hypothetical protein
MDFRMDLYDFGAEPRVSLPPAEQVFDATPLVEAETGQLDGEPKPVATAEDAADPARFPSPGQPDLREASRGSSST